VNPQAQHSKKGDGTIRTIKDRATGAILGFKALLPEAHSKQAGKGARYRKPTGPLHPSWPAARRYLDQVLDTAEAEQPALAHGLRVIDHLHDAIKARHADARDQGMTEDQAAKQTGTWRSHSKVWVEREAFASYPPAMVTRDDIADWIQRLRKARRKNGKPLAPNTIHNLLEMLRQAFRLAKVPTDPTRGHKDILPKRRKPQVPHLLLAEQRALFGCAEIPLRDRVMAGCGMGSAVRVGELLALEHGDLFLDNARPYITVRYGGENHAPTKGRKERRVELFEPALGFFRLYVERFAERDASPRDLLFVDPERDQTLASATGYLRAWPDRFKAWRLLCGVPGLTSHYMRHTYAVSMLSGTWNYDPQTLEFVCKQLGHSEIQTTERYYGKFTVGTWAHAVERMTAASNPKLAKRTIRPLPISALDLLGASNGAKLSKSPVKMAISVVDGQPSKTSKSRKKAPKKALKGASAHHCTGLDFPGAVERPAKRERGA